jgi:hypothetical protein
MIAKCSALEEETEFKVLFEKSRGVEVIPVNIGDLDLESSILGESMVCELIRSSLLLTGMGVVSLMGPSFVDTLIFKDNWLTVIPKDTSLFITAKLKVEKWIIKEAKIKTPNENIYAKISYHSGVPVNIEATANDMKFLITHKYKKIGKFLIPKHTKIVDQSFTLPEEFQHITITYSNFYIPKK